MVQVCGPLDSAQVHRGLLPGVRPGREGWKAGIMQAVLFKARRVTMGKHGLPLEDLSVHIGMIEMILFTS